MSDRCNFLKKAEAHLASIVSSPPSSPTSGQSDSLIPHPISASVDLKTGLLGSSPLKDIKNDLLKVNFSAMSNSSYSPESALFGDIPYAFNSVTKSVTLLPSSNSVTVQCPV